MVDYSNCKLEKVAVHQVGNKTNGEELELSKSLLDIEDEKLNQLLINFFFHSFSIRNIIRSLSAMKISN